MDFKFKSSVKTLKVHNPEGKEATEFIINVGNKDNMKKWITEIKKIEPIIGKISKDLNVLDELEVIIKSIVNVILGDDAYDKLLVISGNSILGMVDFTKSLSEFISEQLKSFYQDYV